MASRLPLKNSSGKYLTDYNGNCLLFNFDIAVCKAVKNMDRPKAELVSENGVAALLVTFTPIQDKQILEAVDKGLVKVRLQLLDHVASGLPEKRSDRVLIPYDYNVNFTFEGQIPEQDQRVSHRNRKAFTRRMAFRKKYYGFTWVDLTAEELAGGKAYLFSEYHDSWYASYDRSNWAWRDYYHYVAVEIYVPALGKGTSDTWQYERQGYFQVSNAVAVDRIGFHDHK